MPQTEKTNSEFFEVILPSGVVIQEDTIEEAKRCIEHFRKNRLYKNGKFVVNHIKVVKETTCMMIDD